MLVVLVDATAASQGRTYRVSCLDAMQDDRPDEGRLAQELGRVIGGGALGKRAKRQSF
jgi:hypothetical protein